MTEDVKNNTTVASPSDAKKDVSAASAHAPVLLKGEIKIFPDKTMPIYDQGPLKAYQAQGKNGGKAFAIICEKNIVPQVEIIQKYFGIVSPHVPKLIGCGVVEWNLDFKEHFTFVYEDKLGNPITVDKNPLAMGLKPDFVISTIFRNIVELLVAMRDKGVGHGNIRTSNIFDGGSTTFESAMLGEILSTPSGLCQPVLYETIPRGLCNPLGKGPAEMSDDIYALGVTVATLIRPAETFENLSDEEIISAKLEMGSFNFIVGKSRFPAGVLELLRGTLNDDLNLRWNFDDVVTWMEGRRVNAKQVGVSAILKASRPLEFIKKKFLKPHSLSISLPKDPAMVVPLVENGELFLWLNRSIQDKDLEKRYDDALVESKIDSGSTVYADRLACCMSIALGPDNPIFYKHINFMPTGFGNLLADAASSKKDLAVFADIIHMGISSFWFKFTLNQNLNVSEIINKLGNCQRFLKQTQVGSGFERCIYYMSPMAPCMSEKLDGFYVRSAEDFLNALEKLSTSKNRPEWFLDRHIIAFLSVRDKSIMEPYLPDLTATERYRQRLGALKMFASIQVRDKMDALPGLTNWLYGMMDPVIDRFHDREKRKRIKDQLLKLKETGNLEKISNLFSRPEETQMDLKNYSEMMKHFQALKKEYLNLDLELANNKSFGMEVGRHTASVVSGLIAVIVIVIYLFVSLTKTSGSIF
jgi:hypothetical protein